MYRSWKPVKKPDSNAAIIYMMDISGSMGHEQKELVRLEAFWIDAWLRRNYDGIESRYIVHDVQRRRSRPRDVLPHPRGRLARRSPARSRSVGT